MPGATARSESKNTNTREMVGRCCWEAGDGDVSEAVKISLDDANDWLMGIG